MDETKALAAELLICAKVGLMPGRLAYRQRTKADLPGLFALCEPRTDLEDVARLLIERIATACTRVGANPHGDSARALFGLDAPRATGLSYASRAAAAARVWQMETKPENFPRRRRPEVLAEIVAQLSDELPAPATSAPDEEIPFLPARYERSGDWRDAATDVERVVDLNTRLGKHTDWRRTVVSQRSGLTEYLVAGRVGVSTRVVAIDDTVTDVLGPFRSLHGRIAWRLRLPHPTRAGEPVRVNYRRELFGKPRELATSDYVSVRSQQSATEAVHIGVAFAGTGPMPVKIVRFITPAATLPNLQGPVWPLPIREYVVADFDPTVPNSSHGMFWWFQPDEFMPA